MKGGGGLKGSRSNMCLNIDIKCKLYINCIYTFVYVYWKEKFTQTETKKFGILKIKKQINIP